PASVHSIAARDNLESLHRVRARESVASLPNSLSIGCQANKSADALITVGRATSVPSSRRNVGTAEGEDLPGLRVAGRRHDVAIRSDGEVELALTPGGPFGEVDGAESAGGEFAIVLECGISTNEVCMHTC